MKRILINATHNEEIRVALCKDNHLYDFDLENRTREQKKANIYKGHITRVEPSLEAAFVEYGSTRQGFLPLREIAPEYLHGNLREDNIKQLLKEGDEVIVQVEKEERGNKGAALSTYISLAGRYLVLMPNNAKAGGISRQISGKVREEMKQIIASLSIPKGMSVIVRTAGLGKGFEDLQNDLGHLLDIWASILDQNKKRPSPCLVHQEAGVVTRAVRDYLRDDISEVWIDSEHAYNEAANFIAAVMPSQLDKLRKYTEYEPMFARFGIERQIETAYQREVRLPSGGSIVIDQTEALVSIDINSSKSTKGSDVSETAFHTNLEAADEIARQLRLRDMGGLIVIDFIDMNDPRHQKEVEKRLIDATRHDRARVQFAEISKFGLMQMSRQRLRPSLEEATGYICPRCHGNGMIRDLRSLSLSIMRQIEQIALKERMGEIQAEVPTDIAAFLLNEKRESLVYLEQDSGTRITILPHAHLESPNFSLHYNPDGFAPSSYERIASVEEEEMVDRGYEVNWQTKQDDSTDINSSSRWQQAGSDKTHRQKSAAKAQEANDKPRIEPSHEPQAVAWLSNLFAPKPQARLAGSLNNTDAAAAIEAIVNTGGVSLGVSGQINVPTHADSDKPQKQVRHRDKDHKDDGEQKRHTQNKTKKAHKSADDQDIKSDKGDRFDKQDKQDKQDKKSKKDEGFAKREPNSHREPRAQVVRQEVLTPTGKSPKKDERTKKSNDKQDKPINPDEVALRVVAINKPEVATSAIHLSLDDSKQQSNKKPSPQADDDKTESVDSKGNATADIKTESKADKADTVEQKPKTKKQKAVKTKDDGQANGNVQTDEAPASTSPQDVADDQHAQLSDQVGADQGRDDSPDDDTPVASAKPKNNDWQIDKARLTQLAHQMNKAINDPRVVIAAHSHQAPISGTAGEFIQKMLGEQVSDDFVANFLKAVSASTQPATQFSFANYGYAPLDDEYLLSFDKQTSVSSRASAPQGKTAVEPRPITRRATNDPRGQHPSFVEAGNDDAATILADQTAVEQIAEQSQHLLQADLFDVSSDEAPLDTSADEQPSADLTAETAEPQTVVVAEVTDVDESEPKPNLAVSSVADKHDDTDGKTDTATPANGNADNTDSTKDQVGGTDKPVKADNKKAKTSANSYKDMIENVAGQLLPQVGILNLAQPKAPKTRTRKASKGDNKPKSEVRKAGAKIDKSTLEKTEKAEQADKTL